MKVRSTLLGLQYYTGISLFIYLFIYLHYAIAVSTQTQYIQ